MPRPHVAKMARSRISPGIAHATAPKRTLSPSERKQLARERLVVLTRLMDEAVYVPILGTRVGLDALLGLVPVAGDLVSAGIGLFLLGEARQLGASRWLQARMLGNLLVDFAVGAVPVAGDLADVYFKAHRRNLKMLQKVLGEPYIETIGPLPARRQ